MFQMVSDNSTMFKDPTVVLSTVRLPLSNKFETCLFIENYSEVLEVYTSLADAIKGHNHLAKIYGVK